MTVTFFSCYLNHHQLSLCKELAKRCDEFYFVATSPTPQNRLELGYEDVNTKYDFVLRTYDGSCTNRQLNELLVSSDAVIFGACPDEYIARRTESGGLSFIYSERFLKKGVWRRFIPSVRKKINDRVVRYKDKELYVLCAGAFLSWELELCGFDTKKCLRWGYFPTVKDYDSCPERSGQKVRLLWAGRFIDWKRPEMALYSARYLKSRGMDFTLDMIGTGEEEKSLRALTRKLSLEDKVAFLGAMSPEKVRENMEKADIFLMTSNFREGWGAVINEAMSTGCAVVVSSAAGATAYLVKDEENGLIFNYSDQESLNRKLERLMLHRELTRKLGEKALLTIKNDFNASAAAERFIEFASRTDKCGVFTDGGPMSAAGIIKNNWYRGKRL